ncbi:hypothetical protein [Massilia orientalis]|uniref:hypothetical protein n=1 Tax=Massilia orientalis TaxID=3050128 RepID=UPI0037DD5557
MLRHLLAVIWIERAERNQLDKGAAHLKNRIPAGWDAQTGCLYTRRHDKGIPFAPAPGYDCTSHA